MRVTKTNPIPEVEIDQVFFPFYEKDNLMQTLLDDKAFISEDIRKNLKKSIFDDYGYDVYSVFENPENENFVDIDTIYQQRIKDFSNFLINAFTATIQGDFERINSLVTFKESELYKEICEKTPDNLERCKILMDIVGNNNDPDKGKQPLNFGYQGVANQLPQNSSQNGSPRGNDKETQAVGDMNSRIEMVSEFSNAMKDKKQAQDLKNAVTGSRTLDSSEKRQLQEALASMEKEMLSQGSKDAGNIYPRIAQILRGIDWSHFYSLNVGNKNSLINTFKSTKEFESSNLPIDGFRMKKIKRSEQVTRASIFEMAMDDDLFYGKFLNQDLIIKDYLKQRKLSQAFYVLLDVSGSMDGIRSVFSRSVVKELLRRVVKGGAKYFFRAFESRPYELHSATNQEEVEKLDKYFSSVEFNGGGTDIKSAIEVAVNDIKKDKAKFEDIDILVITDGEDSFNLDKKELRGLNMSTFLLNEGWERRFGKFEAEKIKKMTKEQLKNYSSGIKSLVINSDNFEVVNPYEQIKINNALLSNALEVGLGSDEFGRSYYSN